MPIVDGKNADFSFTVFTIGLPDHVYLDDKGKVSAAQLKKHINISSRHQARVVEKTLKSKILNPPCLITQNDQILVDYYSDPAFRFRLFFHQLEKYQSVGQKKRKSGFNYLSFLGNFILPSWELSVFHRYSPDILADKSLSGFANKNMDSEANISGIEVKQYNTVSHIADRFFEDMGEWSVADDRSRQLLASVGLALSIIFCRKYFDKLAREHEGFLDYFTVMRNLEYNLVLSRRKVTTQKTEFNSEEDFYQALEKKIQAARENPGNGDVAREIAKLANQMVVWMEENVPSVSMADIISAWTDILFDAGKTIGIPLFSEYDDDVMKLFLKAWTEYFKGSDVQSGTEEDLRKMLASGLSSVKGVDSIIKNLNDRAADQRLQIVGLESSKVSSALERNRSRTVIRKLSSRIYDIENEIAAIQDTAMEALLPPECTMAIFDEDMPEEMELLREEDVSEDLTRVLRSLYSDTLMGTTIVFDEEAGEQAGDIATDAFGDESDTAAQSSVPSSEAVIDTTSIVDEQIKEDTETPDIFKVIEVHEGEAGVESEFQVEDPEPAVELFSEPEEVAVAEEPEPVAVDESVEESRDIALCELGESCRNAINEGFIHGALVNSIASKFIGKGQLELGYRFIKSVDDLGIAGDHFDTLLLKSAYYGMNNWDYGYSHSKSQRLLAAVSQEIIDSWMDMPSDSIVPYLVLAAVFQPAIFGGSYSTAPHLLKYISGNFDGHLRDLLDATFELSSRNHLVSIEALRDEGSEVSEVKFDANHKLNPWIDKITKGHVGYAPLLKAQKHCIDKGLFSKILAIMHSNDRSKTDVIESFILSMESPASSDQLLAEQLEAIGQKLSLDDIFVQARRGFHNKVGELIDICKDWLAVGKTRKGSQIQDYCKKFPTRIAASVEALGDVTRDESADPSRRAGAQLVKSSFQRIQKVIDGDDSAMWSYERAKAWFYHPEHIFHVLGVEKKPSKQVDWMLTELSENFDARSYFDLAINSSDSTLAELMRIHLEDTGQMQEGDDSRSQQCFSSGRQDTLTRCRRLIGQIENASLSSLISDSFADLLHAELDEILNEASGITVLSNMADIQNRLLDIELDMTSKTASRKAELVRLYEEGVVRLKSSVAGDPVPGSWVDDIQSAIDDDNLPVITEMLDELNVATQLGRPILQTPVQTVTVLNDFLAAEKGILDGLASCDQPRDVWHHVVDESNAYELDFSNKHTNLKKVVEALSEWSSKSRPPNNLDKTLYERALTILSFLGIQAHEVGYRGVLKDKSDYTPGKGVVAFNIKLGDSGSIRPFAALGDAGSNNLVFILAYKEWSPEQIDGLLTKAAFTTSVPLLVSAQPISSDKRNQLASYFKRREKAVFHLDTAMALFLGSCPQDGLENRAMRNYLWLATPYTYYNPYVGGDTRNPPPREMRYGRALEIEQLLTPGGPAIVFGGRQLGKSTILYEVKRRYHLPAKRQFAFYRQMDRNMDRLALSRSDWESAKLMVWGILYDELYGARLITKARTKLNANEIETAVLTAMIENKDASVIAIFDEIDPILNVDNAHDFGLFRALREVVNHAEINGRFKLIIAGLENVKRFENSPNYPLPQLGGSIQVSIMPTQDATQLIREPFMALGYSFESAQVVNRILAITNRHPGLIQIFCHELIKSLAANQQGRVGSRVITDDDVTSVYQLQRVMDLIRSRFDMTLNLDTRYLVIIYGLVNESKGALPFTPREAKIIAEAWLPDEFNKLSEKQFEAFLVEMVGLGVLRAEKDGLSNLYALRNTNVLKLLSADGGADVAHQLDRALNDYQTSRDPLDRHAYFKTLVTSSPISYRDEKEILGTVVKKQASSELGVQDARLYTTSIIVGSDAMGADKLKETMPLIYEADINAKRKLKSKDRYELMYRDDTEFTSPALFSDRLKGLLDQKSKDSPIMLMVNITGDLPLSFFLAMLDAAHGHSDVDMGKKYPMRVVFHMTPKAYFQWMSAPELTLELEGNQPFIKLGRWGNGALRYLLDKLGMLHSTDEVVKLENISEGWFISLGILASIVSKRYNSRKKVSELINIEDKYPPLSEVKPSDATEFFEKSGMGIFPWISQMISAIGDSGQTEDLSIDDLFLIAVDAEIVDVDDPVEPVETMAFWMSDMGILNRKRVPNSRDIHFTLSPSIQHINEAAKGG